MADTNIDKIYTPTVIAEAPFPQEDSQSFDTSQSTSGTVGSKETSNAKVDNQPMPIQNIATELLSSALNTKSRKIIQDFSFIAMGAIQIGNYQEGVNGDIRISANGITARNKLGDTTFNIDGETGDAQFKGTLQAGTIIGGNNRVQITDGGAGGQIRVLDSSGNIVIFIGVV